MKAFITLIIIVLLTGCSEQEARVDPLAWVDSVERVIVQPPRFLPSSCFHQMPEYALDTKGYLWSEVFWNPDWEYPDTQEGKNTALCDGITAWGTCHAGGDIPVGFGAGMAKIGKVLGISPTDESLMAYVDSLLEQRKLDERK